MLTVLVQILFSLHGYFPRHGAIMPTAIHEMQWKSGHLVDRTSNCFNVYLMLIPILGSCLTVRRYGFLRTLMKEQAIAALLKHPAAEKGYGKLGTLKRGNEPKIQVTCMYFFTLSSLADYGTSALLA
jgi:hypothetical protein